MAISSSKLKTLKKIPSNGSIEDSLVRTGCMGKTTLFLASLVGAALAISVYFSRNGSSPLICNDGVVISGNTADSYFENSGKYIRMEGNKAIVTDNNNSNPLALENIISIASTPKGLVYLTADLSVPEDEPVSAPKLPPGIYLADHDGSNPRLLTKGISNVTTMVVSKDGSKVSFTAKPNAEYYPRLYVMDSDGNNLAEISLSYVNGEAAGAGSQTFCGHNNLLYTLVNYSKPGETNMATLISGLPGEIESLVNGITGSNQAQSASSPTPTMIQVRPGYQPTPIVVQTSGFKCVLQDLASGIKYEVMCNYAPK